MKRFFLLVCLSISLTSFASEAEFPSNGFTEEESMELAKALSEMYIDAFCIKLKKHYMAGMPLDKAIKATKAEGVI